MYPWLRYPDDGDDDGKSWISGLTMYWLRYTG